MYFYTNVSLHRDNVLVRYVRNGKKYKDIIKYKPYLFVETNKEGALYKNLFGVSCERVDFDTISEARNFIRTYKDVDNFNIYGLSKFEYVYINDEFSNDDLSSIDTSHIVAANIDVETMVGRGFPDIQTADQAITAITVAIKDVYYTFGCKYFKPKLSDHHYILCEDEPDLLLKFLDFWEASEVDVITGWNIEGFDIPYIVNRICRVLGKDEAKRLSPWKLLQEKTYEIYNKEVVTYLPVGVSVLDYVALYKKFTLTQRESYKLDYIAKIELNTGKLDYSEYGSLNDLYEKYYDVFIDYNQQDVRRVAELEKKMRLIELVYTIAYSSKTNYADTLGTVKTWEVISHNHLLNEKNVVIPQLKHHEDSRYPVGGHVKEPLVGMHEWIVSYDLTSLYPHLIMGFNISPETKRGSYRQINFDDIRLTRIKQISESVKVKNLSITGNGIMYDRSVHGFLPELMQKYFDLRSVYKTKMIESEKLYEKTKVEEHKVAAKRYKILQESIKVKINGAYGALANPYFVFHDIELAESITMSGQLTIMWIEYRVNLFLNKLLGTDGVDYVVYSDTDSIGLKLGPLVHKLFPTETDKAKLVDLVDKYSLERITPFIKKELERFSDLFNCYEHKLFMKREVIADKGIWTAKKRYVMNVYDKEGVRYKEPDVKITGMEAVRSVVPEICRNAIKKAIKILLNKTEKDIQDYIQEFQEEFYKQPFHVIATPSSVNGIMKYSCGPGKYIGKTPMHVRGAIMYNELIRRQNLGAKYRSIYDADKIRYCYMKLPNPIKENVIAAPDELPSELGLDRYIDYDRQYYKTFLDPLKIFIHAANWKHEVELTINDFFV